MQPPEEVQAVSATSRPTKGEELEVNTVKDGLIIYARLTDRVHYLNPTAAAIFELADGTRDAGDMARLFEQAFGLPQPPVDEVLGGIRQLIDERVLTL